MKKHILLTLLVLQTILIFGQEKQEVNLLQSNASWGKEIIMMPIHFAPEIPYTGIEELRFSPDWSKKDKDGYWSYVFVWDVDLDKKLTATDIETDLQYYFDGLMDGVNKDKGKILPKTIALFLPKESSSNASEFVGKLQIYNSFHTRDIMQLYCTVQQFYCAEQQKSKVLFRFSPKPLHHTIWNKLNAVQLNKKPCEDWFCIEI